MTDPDMLETAGRALFGADWHRGLARALQVNDSSVRNWMHSRNAIPDGIWDEVATLLRVRQSEVADVLATLARVNARQSA